MDFNRFKLHVSVKSVKHAVDSASYAVQGAVPNTPYIADYALVDADDVTERALARHQAAQVRKALKK